MRVILLLLCLSLASRAAKGAIHIASTPARNDVSNAVALASSGDIVIVPAGSATWTAGLIISNKTIRLIGAGTNSTIITDSVPITTPAPSLIKYYASSNAFLAEIAGFQFISGTVTNETQSRIRVIGASKLVRVHHNVYTNAWSTAFSAEGFLHGVFDHNRVVSMDHSHPFEAEARDWQPYNGATNMAGVPYNFGHGSWADDPYWGSDRFIFWESNVVEDRTSPVDASGLDIFEGGRVVNRFNINTNSLLTNHGTEGQGRSHKQSEDYGNLYVSSPDVTGSLPQLRGGSMLTFSNTFVNITQGYNLVVNRIHNWTGGGWDWAGGTNVYDDNFTNSATAGFWETGTHTGGMNNNGIVDSTKSWATSPQRWLGTNLAFVTRNLTKYNASPIDEQPHSYITGNTATTISYSSQDDPNLRFDTGDTYEVWAVRHSLDQNGQGKDNGLMNGLPGTPAMWPTNATEMSYMWAQSLGFRTSQINQTEGRDWTNGVAKAGYTPFAYPHYLVAGPGLATTPSPSNGATGIAPGAVVLSWSGTNTFFYSVLFDAFNPPSMVLASAQYQQSYTLPVLNGGTTYYWSIISQNFDGLATNTFSFSTAGTTGSPGGGPNKRFRPQ